MPASLVGCQTHKLFMLWYLLVFFFLRGERRRGVCLSKAVLSRFFFLKVSFPCCEKQQSDRAGETSFYFFCLLIFNRGFSVVSSQTPGCLSLWFALAVFNCLVRRGVKRAVWLSIKGEHMIHKGLWGAVCDKIFILSDVTKTNNKRACSSLWHSGKSYVIVWDSKKQL